MNDQHIAVALGAIRFRYVLIRTVSLEATTATVLRSITIRIVGLRIGDIKRAFPWHPVETPLRDLTAASLRLVHDCSSSSSLFMFYLGRFAKCEG